MRCDPGTMLQDTSHVDVSGTPIEEPMLCAIPFHDRTSRVNQLLGPLQRWSKKRSTLADFEKEGAITD